MILVTGATGFVGRALVPRLVEAGHIVRCLVQPSRSSPRLTRNVPLHVNIASLTDPQGLRAALVGVDTVIHLAGTEWRGSPADLMRVDYAGSRHLLEAAIEAEVRRFMYLSHLGADRASAFSVHKTKGIIEEFIRKSNIPSLIVRSSLLYGPEDVFTNTLTALLRVMPGFFLYPGDGQVQLQPLWIEDLATCLVWSLDEPDLFGQTISIGGPEFLNLTQVLNLIMKQIGVRRLLVSTPLPYLRWMVNRLRSLLPGSPITSNWLDHIAVNRTCEINSLQRYFDLKPARFEQTMGYLERRHWRSDLHFVLGGAVDERKTTTPETARFVFPPAMVY